MATRGKNKPEETNVQPEVVEEIVETTIPEPEEYEELNLDVKVTVRSIAPWKTTFARISDGFGDVTLSPNGTVRLSRNEIISQIQNGNVLFTGTDGKGSHATLFIEDKPTRKEVDFESADSVQTIFSKEAVSRIFSCKRQDEFEKEFRRAIRTRAEKWAVMNEIKASKINDYSKIRFAEKYTGLKMEKI